MVERLLGLAGDADPDVVRAKLRAFRRFALLHGAARSWLWIALVPEDATPGGPLAAPAAAALSLCLGLAFTRRWEQLAPRLALPVLGLQLLWTFPLSDNHFFLEVVAVTLLCLDGGEDPQDEALVLQGLQWTTALVLFHTGLQKALYGAYFQGDFLAFMIGVQDRFAAPFAWLVPADEIARLQGYDPMQTGAGPYRVAGWPLRLVSNAVWLAELALPALLLWRRTRAAATLAALALVLAIQLGAREAGFALLFGNLLLLFAPTALNARLLPVAAAAYVWALGAAAGLLPGGGWLDPGYL